VAGPCIVPMDVGASLAINLFIALLVVVEHAGKDADNQILPCPKLLAAETVMVFVPAPEVIVKPLGMVQL